MNAILAFLAYPGLLLMLALAGATALLLDQGGMRHLRPAAAWRSREGSCAFASLLLIAAAATLLPWPAHPALLPVGVRILLLPLLVELAVAVLLAPGLVSGDPLVRRASSREHQIGLAARLVVWLCAGTAQWVVDGDDLWQLLMRVLLCLAYLLALPGALGFGPFGPEAGLAPAGSATGLDRETGAWHRFALAGQRGLMLVVLPVVILPVQALAWPVGLALTLAVVLATGVLIRQIEYRIPRQTAPAAIRWSLTRATLPALLALALLAARTI